MVRSDIFGFGIVGPIRYYKGNYYFGKFAQNGDEYAHYIDNYNNGYFWFNIRSSDE